MVLNLVFKLAGLHLCVKCLSSLSLKELPSIFSPLTHRIPIAVNREDPSGPGDAKMLPLKQFRPGKINNSTRPGFCHEIDFSSDSLFLSVLYGILFCIGLPTNCLALVGLYRLVKEENILPVFVINLLLSDLIQIGILPLWIDYYLSNHKWNFGRDVCSIVGCVFYISVFVSVFFMCCVAVERYLAIAHPLCFGRYRRLSNAIALSVGLWVLVTGGIFLAFFIGLEDDENDLCMETYDSATDYAAFQLTAMTVTFLLPLVLLVYIYVSARRKIASVASVPPREKKKIIWLLLLIVSMFVVVFGPYHIMVYVNYAGILYLDNSCKFQARIFIYVQVATGLLSLNSILDPVMYIFIRKDFQKAVLRRFPFLASLKCWRCVAADRQDSSYAASMQLENAA
ncbi:hypothetical protein JZ751_025636 [Albula glossodonta]|uniref:G-protein coupled receptors family 1 profile domain-containing protein n=1 Tax=Albula glossodonta TaxID=121402 RepID=A0A8T2NLW3_9TELE|nr:hypothetical protein JZ751_025636 [Albula glossodonta]